MLVRIGAPSIETSDANGSTVAVRKGRFGSQAEQIVWLRGMVEKYRETHLMVARARDIVFRQRQCPPKDQACQALAIGQWVQDTITYVAEMPERFQTPPTTISEGYGDCDDFSTLIASLCEAVGIETELVGLEYGQGPSRYYKHIFPRAIVRQGGRMVRIPLDATLDAPVDGRQDPIRIAMLRGVHDLRVFVA